MGLDQDLLDILICPDCHADVEYKERRKVIVCTGCGLLYPVRDGIPVMLVEEAKRPTRRGSSS
ncbi:MAG: Trm112 family protein [Nitriliruptorales bacterium]